MTEPREELEFNRRCALRAMDEQPALVDDISFKADLLRVAEKALEDVRAVCISSMYWQNDEFPNCARILKHHHKIVNDAKVKMAEMRAIQYGDDVDA